MDFGKKLQALRKQKGLTQEELAKSLYVSRTAISKWESGRGTPSIESLKSISSFFSVTVDELLSSEQILNIAEEDRSKAINRFRDLIFGIVDICALLFLFLPLFASSVGGEIVASSLLNLIEISIYLKVIYYVVTFLIFSFGVVILVLQNLSSVVWIKMKFAISIFLSLTAVVLFAISSQPYATVFALFLLVIKAFTLIKR